MVDRLEADGLIVHINPLQEWFQKEGDRFIRPPIEVIEELTSTLKIKIIVKEVGQGIGPESMRRLMALPLAAIEFAGFGGTNFSKLEQMRRNEKLSSGMKSLASVGHESVDMIEDVNGALKAVGDRIYVKEFIISGGIDSFLDGFYLMGKFQGKSIYGMAGAFLPYLNDYKKLHQFLESEIDGLMMAKSFLRVRK
jgi:isopentenyl-diphosphate delta-isomerase